MTVTKQLLEEAFGLLKNDPHYYVNHDGGIEELYKELEHLKDELTALNGFADSLDAMQRDAIAKNLAKKNRTHKNN